MFEVIEKLTLEIIDVQILDQYFKNGKIYLEDYFIREEYLQELKSTENIPGLIDYYEDKEIEKYEMENESVEYTYDEVMQELVRQLDFYSYIYKMKNIVISNEEWDDFFETVAQYYLEKGIEDYFVCDIFSLNKMVIAKSLVYEDEEINLETYVSSLKYMESNILSLDDIVELTKKLSNVFDKDMLPLITNSKGEYGCIEKNTKLYLLNSADEISQLDPYLIKLILEDSGYKVVTGEDKINEGDFTDIKKKNTTADIIDFDAYVKKKKNK